MRKLLSLLLLAAFIPVACTDKGDDVPAGQPPVITWAEASARFRIYLDESLMLVPDIEGLDETSTFVWTIDGRVVSTTDSYTFVAHATGEYFVHLLVTNRYGKSEDEVKVTVLESQSAPLPDVPEETRLWLCPWTEVNIAQGRTVKVQAYVLRQLPSEARFSWDVDGTPQPQATASEYVFTGSAQGRHTLRLTLETPDTTATQEFVVNVCAPAGTFRRGFAGDALVNKIYEYMPAPGHQVNGYIIVGDSYPPDCTHEQACDSVLAHMQRRWSVSLGSQGGYLIAGFDHSVRNSGGDYDLSIKGNPFSYQSEPGIVWVSQDDNGDGLPNDQWFELAGSELRTANHRTDYAITYYRPAVRRSATAWCDIDGRTGYVPYMSYWNPNDSYWQPWVEGTARTYFGSQLADHSTYSGGYSDIPPYGWGYADNLGSDYVEGPAGLMNHVKISAAIDHDGAFVDLEYIDFVKIQTAQIGSTPNLGDISTEVYYIGDYHCE